MLKFKQSIKDRLEAKAQPATRRDIAPNNIFLTGAFAKRNAFIPGTLRTPIYKWGNNSYNSQKGNRLTDKRAKLIEIASSSEKREVALNSWDRFLSNKEVTVPAQNALDNYELCCSHSHLNPWPASFDSLSLYMAITNSAGYKSGDNKFSMVRSFAEQHNLLTPFSLAEEARWKVAYRAAGQKGFWEHSQALPISLTLIEQKSNARSITRAKSLFCFYFGLRPSDLCCVNSTSASMSECGKWFRLNLRDEATKRPVHSVCAVKCSHAQGKLPVGMCICSAWKTLTRHNLIGDKGYDPPLFFSDEFKDEVSAWTGEESGVRKGYGFRIGAVEHLYNIENKIGKSRIIRHFRWKGDEVYLYYLRNVGFPTCKYSNLNFLLDD